MAPRPRIYNTRLKKIDFLFPHILLLKTTLRMRGRVSSSSLRPTLSSAVIFCLVVLNLLGQKGVAIDAFAPTYRSAVHGQEFGGYARTRANQFVLTTKTNDAPLTTSLCAIRGGAVGSAGFGLVSLLKAALSDVSASKTKCWTILITGILLESVATSISKHARNTGSFNKYLFSCCLYLMSTSGFCVALAQIEVGIAYACWAALGTGLVSASGVFFFGESCDFVKLFCLTIILAGVAGLNLRK